MPTIRTTTMAAIIIGLSAAITPYLLAQGKSGGLGRGLSAAAKGSSASGLAKAASKSGNATNRVLRSGSTFGRAAGGLQRGDATIDSPVISTGDTSTAGQPLDNQQRILDQRLEQADHLRAISAANGNQHLLDTADRMQANATTNFERQQQRLNQTATDTSANSSTSSPPPSTTVETSSAPLVDAPQARTRRGFWFRSR